MGKTPLLGIASAMPVGAPSRIHCTMSASGPLEAATNASTADTDEILEPFTQLLNLCVCLMPVALVPTDSTHNNLIT